VNFSAVCDALADEVRTEGGVIRLGCEVAAMHAERDIAVITTADQSIEARAAVNCGGLHSDELAAGAGASLPGRIVPFRGEYFELVPDREFLVRHLVYPVPDPRFPFLGVHFTRGIDG